jgi:EAL domain-containing protein (putative c-di-GMP-specific phosphodiesterase class I)/cellobiose-specific phosphotransferase system component IIC
MGKNNTFIIILFSMREALVSLFPYFLFRALGTLYVGINDEFLILDTVILNSTVKIIYDIFPLLLCFSLAIHLATNFQLHKTNFSLFVLATFMLLSGYFELSETSLTVHAAETIIYSLSLPIIIVLLIIAMKKIQHFVPLVFNLKHSPLNNSFKYLMSYFALISIASTSFANTSKILISTSLNTSLNTAFNALLTFSIEIQALTHILISHMLWLLGIHGSATLQHFLYNDFYAKLVSQNSAFVSFGGAGSTISLIAAILIFSKDKNSRTVAKFSSPFALFNINEPLIYGLPIALSKQYIIPFILTPIINFSLSMVLFKFGFLSFSDVDISWNTPPLISGYLLTDSVLGSLWQLILIVIGIYIYKPFLVRESSAFIKSKELMSKLGFNEQIGHEDKEFYYHNKFKDLVKERNDVTETLQNVIDGNLELYYQPQISIENGGIYGFEALLRLNHKGQIHSPMFLSAIEQAGLEEVIDMWTVKQVVKDRKKWILTTSKPPLISLNIHPKTLLNKEYLDYIINELGGNNVNIELLERGFIDNFSEINSALLQLKMVGINTAIDDYGTGEANLSIFAVVNSNIVKLDRSLLRHWNTSKGGALFKLSCKTFKEMGLIIIVEGVETQDELDFVKTCNVDAVQGWYYAKGMPLESAIEYKITY